MHCDAIVIGGGIVGLSTALHLAESGLQKVLVLERRLLTSGASGLGTGSVHTQRWFATDSELVQRSKAMFSRLSEGTGGIFRLYPVGRLTVVGDEDADAVSAYGARLRDLGIDAVELWPDELQARFPGMNVADVGRALYTGEDGVVYPPAMVWAMNGLFRNAGGVVWEGCGARRIALDDGRVTGVELENGDRIDCGRVILTSGIWSRRILRASGLDLALKFALTHNSIVTVGRTDRWSQVPSLLDGIQGVIAIPRNPGTIMAANTAGEHEAASDVADNVLNSTTVEVREHAASFKLETKEQQSQVVAELRHRYRDYDIRDVVGHWAGVLDGTPDNHPFVGPYPSALGLWVGCGLTGYGVQRGPGVGEVLADMALERPLKADVSQYNLDRFDSGKDFSLNLSSDNPFAGFKRLEMKVGDVRPVS